MALLKSSNIRTIGNLYKTLDLLVFGCTPEKSSPIGSSQAQTGEILRAGTRRVRETTSPAQPELAGRQHLCQPPQRPWPLRSAS